MAGIPVLSNPDETFPVNPSLPSFADPLHAKAHGRNGNDGTARSPGGRCLRGGEGKPRPCDAAFAWLNDHVNDTYVKLAAKEGYRARAAYKLKEIDEAFGLIRPGHLVVDLGSTPGAWSQYVRRRLSPAGAAVGQLDGSIIALDLLPMDPIEGVIFLQGDFRRRRCSGNWSRRCRAGESMWWSPTWHRTSRASARPMRRASLI